MKMGGAFHSRGSAILRMTVGTDRTKEISARKKLAPITSSRALDQVTVYHGAGSATVTMTASTKLTKTTALLQCALLRSFSAPTRSSVSMKAIVVTELVTAKMGPMNKAARRWRLISAIWRNPSNAKSRGCASPNFGTVTEMLTVKMAAMNHPLAAKLIVRKTTSSATIPSASSSPGFVMAVMTVETTPMRTAGMPVLHPSSSVNTASGFVPALPTGVSTYRRCAMGNQTVRMARMKDLVVHQHRARATRPAALMGAT